MKNQLFGSLLSVALLLSACQNTPANTNGEGKPQQSSFNTSAGKWVVQQASATGLLSGKRRTVYFDSDTHLQISLLHHRPQPVSDFKTKQLNLQLNFNSQFCEVFTLEAKAIERPSDLPATPCQPWYRININGQLAATFPITYPDGNDPNAVNIYHVYGPCTGACDNPLQIQIQKSPQTSCLLNNGTYTGTQSSSENIVFQPCPAPTPVGIPSGVDVFHSQSIQRLLDSGEQRLDVIERDANALIEEAQQLYPEIGAPPGGTP